MKTYTLNQTGRNAIKTFVTTFSKNNVVASAYYSIAENAANDFSDGYSATIEISQHMSNDKLPHILNLSENWFDIVDVE